MSKARVVSPEGEFVYTNARIDQTLSGVEYVTGDTVTVNGEDMETIRMLHRRSHLAAHGNLDEYQDGIRLDHGFEIIWEDE